MRKVKCKNCYQGMVTGARKEIKATGRQPKKVSKCGYCLGEGYRIKSYPKPPWNNHNNHSK